ncbi:MAG TPA: aldehyde dehydrogenase family protein, partial [Thermoplasmata archaeon]|nr:aldehyde dehydrogenase family protein [Thermoplasmata archaeon]
YSGQVCTASKRVLVAESIADRFAARFTEAVGSLKVGRALEESTQVGPVVTPDTLDRLDRLIEDAEGRHANLLTGGTRVDELAPGWFFRPTVLDHVPPDAAAAREEPFGPLAPILRFHDLDDAVRIANGTSYGLQAAIYTNDLRRAFEFVRRVRAGGVHVNDPTNLRWDALPFGGVRESGLGREGLRYAMHEMTEVKLVSVNFG